jgi:hypothetical protein
LSFILASPPLSFFLSASTAATCIFTTPICTATIITLEPSALNVQHFIPRFNKILLLCRYHWKRGWGVRPKDRVTLQTILSHLILVKLSAYMANIS